MGMKYRIKKIRIHHYRSISELTINFPSQEEPSVICGPNNVGKTNILRALNLFFHEKFAPEDDIPYHIVEGSRGQGFKSVIEICFWDEKAKTRWTIKKEFTQKKKIITIKKTGQKHVLRVKKSKLEVTEIDKFLKKFWYIFIEASNVNLPKMIGDIVKTDVLSAGLDHLRKKQKIPLETLEEFISTSRETVKGIEDEIGEYFKEFIKKNDSIKKLKSWNIEINFPEFETLREAIADMVTFTLYDANRKKLDFKGSGIQRLLFLSLVRYISANTKKNVIWGIDEPEVFLQPGLQKEVYNILRNLAEKLTIILTTHSHHFINLNELDSCLLLDADYEIKKYERRPDEEYFKVDTHLNHLKGYEKVVAIKSHMGIQNNDSWEIVPYNVLVEGFEDKEYISTLLRSNDLSSPNIFVAGGADKIKGYLSFLNDFAQDLSYKPEVLCVLDYDSKGREIYNALADKYPSINVYKIYVGNWAGDTGKGYNHEIEDLIYPEILLGAVNEILKKKKYQTIDAKKLIQKKKQKGYLKENILRFITNEVTTQNPQEDKLDFETEALKKWLCKITCIKITYKRCEKLKNKYPEVKEFLDSIIKI
ncbi:MAG: AAA family ATPase [Candidatus Aadella gelida]|nr:AAA family ATPase [Candidatus Aadella gelida]